MDLRHLILGALIGLLHACASMPPSGQAGSAPGFVVPIQLEDWSANGKFSFRSPENRESGQFYWSQSEQDYLLRLIGPLGVGVTEVERDEQGVTVRSRGEAYQGELTEQLVYSLTGISVPLNQMSDLLLGRTPAIFSDWEVLYEGAVEIDAYRLPQQLTLTSGDMVLQIFISRWSI